MLDCRNVNILKTHHKIIMYLVLVQGAARNPNAADQQQKLKQAAEDLRSATNAAASDALKKKLVKRLEVIIMKKSLI